MIFVRKKGRHDKKKSSCIIVYNINIERKVKL